LTPPLLARSSASAILCDREWVNKSPHLRTDFLVEETSLKPPVFPFSLDPGLCPQRQSQLWRNNTVPQALTKALYPSIAQTPQVCTPVIAQDVDYRTPFTTLVVWWAAVDNRSRNLHVSSTFEFLARASIPALRKPADGDDAWMADRCSPARRSGLG
jgi:hypothetical protein